MKPLICGKWQSLLKKFFMLPQAVFLELHCLRYAITLSSCIDNFLLGPFKQHQKSEEGLNNENVLHVLNINGLKEKHHIIFFHQNQALNKEDMFSEFEKIGEWTMCPKLENSYTIIWTLCTMEETWDNVLLQMIGDHQMAEHKAICIPSTDEQILGWV